MTANPNHYARATSVACPSCGFPNAIRETGTNLQYCQNDISDTESDIAYRWQRKHHPDKEPTSCETQFFVDARLQIVARVSTVQWEDEKPVSIDDLDSTVENISALGNKLRRQLGADSNE